MFMKIIQNNYNAKINQLMDNYGGSADQLVIMQIVTYNWTGQTWL